MQKNRSNSDGNNVKRHYAIGSLSILAGLYDRSPPEYQIRLNEFMEKHGVFYMRAAAYIAEWLAEEGVKNLQQVDNPNLMLGIMHHKLSKSNSVSDSSRQPYREIIVRFFKIVFTPDATIINYFLSAVKEQCERGNVSDIITTSIADVVAGMQAWRITHDEVTQVLKDRKYVDSTGQPLFDLHTGKKLAEVSTHVLPSLDFRDIRFHIGKKDEEKRAFTRDLRISLKPINLKMDQVRALADLFLWLSENLKQKYLSNNAVFQVSRMRTSFHKKFAAQKTELQSTGVLSIPGGIEFTENFIGNFNARSAELVEWAREYITYTDTVILKNARASRGQANDQRMPS